MPRTHPHPPNAAHGFSIVELIVSISIIAILIGITFPVISVMTSSSRAEAGLNVAGMSADVARQWVQAEAWANDASTQAPINERYSGTAALFCPTDEIRIVANDRNARDGTAFLEDQPQEQNGYEDLSQVAYIKIPNGVGVAGVYKDPRPGPNFGQVRFIAPPFAIAFNELGQLNYGDNRGLIYYDSNGDNRYNRAQARTAGYNPSEWNDTRDEDGNDPNGNNNFTSGLSLTLPFEAIECVSGVVVYDTKDFAAAGFGFEGGGSVALTSAEGRWLQDNGETLFFSPHTGAALRDEN